MKRHLTFLENGLRETDPNRLSYLRFHIVLLKIHQNETIQTMMKFQDVELSLAHEARIINGNIRKHIKNSNFSTTLHGRFYKNSSLHAHKNRIQKFTGLQQKRITVQRNLEDQEKKIRILEEKLREKERIRNETIRCYGKFLHSVIALQSAKRAQCAKSVANNLKLQKKSRHDIAVFLQKYYHGSKARRLTHHIKTRNICLIAIQAFCRGILRRNKIASKKLHQATIKVQSVLRMSLSRHHYNLLLRQRNQASSKIISFFRKCRERNVREKSDLLGDPEDDIQELEASYSLMPTNNEAFASSEQAITNERRKPFVVPGIPRKSNESMTSFKEMNKFKKKIKRKFSSCSSITSIRSENETGNYDMSRTYCDVHKMNSKVLKELTYGKNPIGSELESADKESREEMNEELQVTQTNQEEAQALQYAENSDATLDEIDDTYVRSEQVERNLIPATFESVFEEDLSEDENDLDLIYQTKLRTV